MREIHKADPVARRTALILLGCGAVVGVVAITVAKRLRPELEAWIEQDLVARLRLVVGVATLLAAGPTLGLAVYVWRMGRRIVSAQRLPPPGLRTVRDTRVVTGSAASYAGRLIQLLAVVLGLASLLLVVFAWRLVALLRTGPV